MAKLRDIANISAGNSAPNKNEFSEKGIPFVRAGSLEFLVRGVSIQECEKIDPLIVRENKLKLFKKGAILFAKSGMSAKMGRIYVLPEDAFVVSHLAVITVTDENTNNNYIAYYFNHRPPFNLIKDDAYPSISISDIADVEIPLPDLETQNKIVAILDKAKAILNKREETITKYNELLRAIFVEMFGDPVINPKRWELKSLLEFGEFKNGLNYTRDESGFEIPCLGVGDFKSLWKISDINRISKISLSKSPSDEYLLQNDDLVFVRSNGNKELVGRCVLVYPNELKISYSGFCIRYRTYNREISPIYLANLFRIPNFRKSMLQNGRGANIQNINQQLLGNLRIPNPPIELQLEFEKKIESLQKALTQVSLFENFAGTLLRSLSQQVFNERITIDVDAELEALVNAVDLDKEDSENKISTLVNDVIFIQRLIDRLNEKEFEDKEQYAKAKYILFRIMKEEKNLVKQVFKDNKVQLTLLNETA